MATFPHALQDVFFMLCTTSHNLTMASLITHGYWEACVLGGRGGPSHPEKA
jgi:hypothetical protein